MGANLACCAVQKRSKIDILFGVETHWHTEHSVVDGRGSGENAAIVPI